MNRDMLKRIIAILLLGSLLLGLIPMIALATEADAAIRQTVYKEGVGVRVAMTGPIDPAELIVTSTASAEPISAMVLVKASAEAEDPQIIVGESEDTSIGIIGGADGPTAVLVSGNWGAMIAMTAAVICALIAVIVALKNRKK